MSRAYRISLTRDERRRVEVEDGVRRPLELLPILPADRLRALLVEELERRGFEVEGEVLRRRGEAGVTVDVDLDRDEVTVRVDESRDIEVRATATARPDRSRPDLERRELAARVQAQLDAGAERARERLRRSATETLERAIGAVDAELDAIVDRVTKRALEERARRMGEIEELREDPETGSLVIKVKL